MQKIAMIYICTWNYDVFWEDFYNSSEKNFLPDCEKHYFVFTDSKKIISRENITVILQEKEEWPHPTLKRFINIISLWENINKYNQIIFNNANTVFKKYISIDDINLQNKNFFWVRYIPYTHLKPKYFPYDRNIKTSAFMKENEWIIYYSAAFFWWKTSDFLELCEELNNWYESDKIKWDYPIWHDESYLNKYFYLHHNEIKILWPEYGYPEFSYFNVKCPKVVFSSKEKYGGWNYLRKTWYKITTLDKIIYNSKYYFLKISVSIIRLFRVRKLLGTYKKIVLKKEDF